MSTWNNKKYKYAKREGVWEVRENATDQVVDKFPTHDMAAKRARFMERGGAFAGWTPSFILVPCTINDSVDDQLSGFFA